MPKVPHLLPTAEAAQKLNCDVRTIHRMVARGDLTPVVQAPGLRGAMLFDSEEIERLAIAGRVAS